MKMLESGYTIRAARAEELPLLEQIERSAAILFLDTPYAFLVFTTVRCIHHLPSMFPL
jgi:hypothetical protein